MATITKRSGRYIIQFDLDGRRTVTLGRVADRQARTVKAHIEHLAAARASNTAPPVDTAAWLVGLSDKLHTRLANAGLVTRRVDAPALHLDQFFKAYLARRSDLKPRTVANMNQVKTLAVQHFGKVRLLSSITRGDVKDWHRWLSGKFAEATVAMHVKKMRQLFADAMDRKLLTENPFKSVKAGSMVNEARDHYIPAEDIEAVIEACPNQEWKTLFALARYGGLRVPSETRLLRWSDVDWQTLRMNVRSPKTERHADKKLRSVPIQPALAIQLRASFELAEPGALKVLPTRTGENQSTTAQKIVDRSGVQAWKKIWMNLRASCETDWAACVPIHAACKFIGNSALIARKHYLRVTDSDFDTITGRAVARAAESAGKDRKFPERDSHNLPDLPRDSRYLLPPRVVRVSPVLRRNLIESHRALQQALHSTKKRVSRERARMYRNLRSAVDAAKRRVASSPAAPAGGER